MALINLPRRNKMAPRTPFLKKLIWLYFLLLIFEGALRKWIVPQLSAPLLLVRDPIALLIIWEAYRTHKWPKQWAGVIGILSAGILVLCFVQLVSIDLPWFVALYGVRSYLIPFPVAFIIGEVLDENDLRKFGNCTLWLLLPMTVLEIAQYYAPSSSFLNKGASLGTVQLDYAFGHVRASGTFSYVTGPTFFLPLAATFLFYGIVNAAFAKKWLLWACACALIIGVPVTGSRTQLVLLGGLLACVVIASMFGVSQLADSLKVIVAIFAVVLLVSQLPSFSDATSTLEARLSMASETEGGARGAVDSRVSLPIIETIDNGISSGEWFGTGIGIGSNAAASLLTGTQAFLAGESEMPRVITEFGVPLGIAFILFRILLTAMIAAKALSRVREHQPLAWFLVPTVALLLLLGTLEQPTVQGFMVVTLGFALAALKRVEVIHMESAKAPDLRLIRRKYVSRVL